MKVVEIQGRKAVSRSCPLCSRASGTAPLSRYSDSLWLLKVCPDCGFVYLAHAPVYEELVSEHSWEKSSVEWKETRKERHPILFWISRRTRWRFRLFRRKSVEDMLSRFVSGGNVLDVGCGKGDQLRKLPDRYVPFGVEISEAEAACAEEHIQRRGGKIVVGPAIEGLREFPDGIVDGVFMRSYLEHEAAPGGVLEETRRVLRPGGVLVIKVPNFACVNRMVLGRHWSGFRTPDHLNYFTPRTLRVMCREAGLVILRFGLRDRLPFGDNMWLVAARE